MFCYTVLVTNKIIKTKINNLNSNQICLIKYKGGYSVLYGNIKSNFITFLTILIYSAFTLVCELRCTPKLCRKQILFAFKVNYFIVIYSIQNLKYLT